MTFIAYIPNATRGADLPEQTGYAVLFNDTPDRALVIHSVDHGRSWANSFDAGLGPAELPGSIQLATVTAYTLSNRSADTGQEGLVAYDTNNVGALPSQVTFVRNPDTVTVDRVLRNVILSTQGLGRDATATTMVFGDGNYFPEGHDGSAHVGLHRKSELARYKRGSTEAIVLREGQGLALLRNMVNGANVSRLTLTVRDATNSKTYEWAPKPVVVPGYPGDAAFVLWNGAGSGIVLEVIAIDIPPSLSPTTANTYRHLYGIVTGIIEDYAGRAGTFIAMDPAKTVPPGVTCGSGPFHARFRPYARQLTEAGFDTEYARQAFVEHGAVVAINGNEYATLLHSRGSTKNPIAIDDMDFSTSASVHNSHVMMAPRALKWSNVMWEADPSHPTRIYVGPGQAFAVIQGAKNYMAYQGDNATHDWADVRITFDVTGVIPTARTTALLAGGT